MGPIDAKENMRLEYQRRQEERKKALLEEYNRRQQAKQSSTQTQDQWPKGTRQLSPVEYFSQTVPIVGSVGETLGAFGAAGVGTLTGQGNFGDIYRKERDISRAERKRFEQENPASAMALGFGSGAIVSPAGLLTQAGISAADTALSEESGTSGALSGVITAGLGAATKPVAKYGGAAADWAGEKLKKAGVEQAWDALSSGFKKLTKKGEASEGFIPQEAGQFALESGAMNPILGVFGNSWKAITGRLEAAEEKARGDITKLVNDLTAAGAGEVSPTRIILGLRQLAAQTPKREVGDQYHRTLSNVAKQIQEDYGQRPMSQRQLQDLKNRFAPQPQDAMTMEYNRKKALQDVRGTLSKAQNEGVESGIEQLGRGFEDTADLARNYQRLKTSELGALNAIEGARERTARIATNRTPSLTDYLMGGAAGVGFGVGTGDWSTGLGAAVGLGLGNRYVRNRMQQTVAANLYSLGRMLKGETKYSGILRQAAERGQANLGLTHMILLQRDPDYRSTVQSLEQEGASQ
jgi:hypothetical protein